VFLENTRIPHKQPIIKILISKKNINADQYVSAVEVFASVSPMLAGGAEGIIFLRSSASRCSVESSRYVCTDIISWISLSWLVAAVKPKK